MFSIFLNVKKVCLPESGAALVDPRRTFSSGGERWRDGFSRRTQVGQPFEVPTHAFELQFQPVAFATHIPHPPITGAALPPAEYFLNLTADRTEQPVHAHGGQAQLLPPAGLVQNPVGHAVLTAPLAARLTPIGFVKP